MLTLQGDLTPEQRERLREIADRCPVSRTLEKGSRIITTLAD
jgi:putative redox protein